VTPVDESGVQAFFCREDLIRGLVLNLNQGHRRALVCGAPRRNEERVALACLAADGAHWPSESSGVCAERLLNELPSTEAVSGERWEVSGCH
jgi:hypothetical protein